MAENHCDAETAEQRRQAESGGRAPALVWQAVISSAPKANPANAVALAAITTKRRRPSAPPEATPHLL